MPSPLLGLLPLLVAHRRLLVFGVAGQLIAAACNIAGPLLVAHAIDVDLASGSYDGLMLRCAEVGGTVLLGWGAVFFARISLETAAARAMATLKQRLFDHLLHLDATFHDKTASGSLIGRIQGDVEALRTLLVEVLLALPADAFLMIGMLAALQIRAPAMVWPVLGVMPLYLLLFGLFRLIAPPFFQRQRALVSRVTARIAETVRVMPILRVLERHLWGRDTAIGIVDEAYRADVIANLQPIWYFNAAGTLRTFSIAALLVWGAARITDGSASVGTLVLAISYLRLVFQPLLRLSDHLATLERARASAVRIDALLALRSALAERGDPAPWPGLAREIAFEQVSFSYVEDRPVLRDFNLVIPAGSRIGIVGPTGSGKSTLIDLLLRFRDPVSGRVCIDGVDLKSLSLADLRDHTALVLQDVQLMPGTLRENLGGTPEQCENALAAVGLDWSLDKTVSDDSLSRGERQLITFARALVGNPALIVLDEATSAIDPSTEAKINSALDRIALGRTVVIIAHRLRTVRRCDKICVMRAGALVESGTHAELVLRDGMYAELVREQTGEAA